LIYDFDDAIWMPDPSATNRFFKFIKAQWKVKWICRWSHRVVGGNDYLCEYARAFNESITCIPTVIDMEIREERLKVHGSHRVVVGWTGSHSTLRFLDPLVPLLQRLQEELVFDFLVIADKDPQLPLKFYRFMPWSPKTERQDLLQLDIGVMPLTSDVWSEGKCGFKLIQYYSLGIPALASPVGVNSQIIQSGENGFLCATDKEWKRGLRELIESVELRSNMGRVGYERMISHYSLAAQEIPFLKLFKE
jgi:glycosyltransferase involved in cell wall biosynthesis